MAATLVVSRLYGLSLDGRTTSRRPRLLVVRYSALSFHPVFVGVRNFRGEEEVVGGSFSVDMHSFFKVFYVGQVMEPIVVLTGIFSHGVNPGEVVVRDVPIRPRGLRFSVRSLPVSIAMAFARVLRYVVIVAVYVDRLLYSVQGEGPILFRANSVH